MMFAAAFGDQIGGLAQESSSSSSEENSVGTDEWCDADKESRGSELDVSEVAPGEGSDVENFKVRLSGVDFLISPTFYL